MLTQVVFTYDESSRKWEAQVTGVNNEQDAKDAFRAVLISCSQLRQVLQDEAPVEHVDGVYKITPAV